MHQLDYLRMPKTHFETDLARKNVLSNPTAPQNYTISNQLCKGNSGRLDALAQKRRIPDYVEQIAGKTPSNE